MTMLTYTQLLNDTLSIYSSDGPLAAFDYIEERYQTVSGILPQLFNFRYALAAASGQKEKALDIFEDAIISHGFWYNHDYLNSDDDLDILRDDPRFTHCLKICKTREIEAKKASTFSYEFIEKVTQMTLDQHLIVFHGNQENVQYTAPYWQQTATEQYDKVFYQSPTLDFTNGHLWLDSIDGYGEIFSHLRQYKNRVMSGFSAGGHMALHSALKHPEYTTGLILVAPWLPDLSIVHSQISILKDNEIPLYIICGDQDEDCLECTEAFVTLLEKNCIPYSYKKIAGLSHDYPVLFEKELKEGLRYIEGHHQILRAIQKTVKTIKISTILDMGIGTGRLSAALYDDGYKVTGIDYSKDMIDLAAKKMPCAELILRNFKDGLPKQLSGQSYDAIISSFAIHTLRDSEKLHLITDLYQHLSYGGVIIIGDTAFESKEALNSYLDGVCDPATSDKHYYCNESLAEELKNMGINSSYEQVSCSTGLLKIIKV